MKKSKRESLNKITIYQMPVFEKIMGTISVLVLTPLPVIALILSLYETKKEFILVLFLLFAMILYSVLMYFSIFKTYIRLDTENKKLIIRESPGIKEEHIRLDNLIDIKVSDNVKYKELFTIDICCKGYTKKIISWSAHPSCRLAMFGVYRRQTKRLKRFAKECNDYIKQTRGTQCDLENTNDQ